MQWQNSNSERCSIKWIGFPFLKGSKILKTTRMTFIIALLSLLFGLAYGQGIPTVTQTQFMMPPDDLRDFRYCMIIAAFRKGLNVNIDLYNSMSLNDCPTAAWNALDQEELKKTYGAVEIRMNGPRFWVLNQISGTEVTATGQIVDFGGIEMQRISQLEVSIFQGSSGSEPYEENEVQLSTRYSYHANNMVYELSSPNSEVYRMQSYSQIIDPNLSINDLESLGERLNLPAGWTYNARVLTEDSELKADGLAFVINDDLGNSYHKILNE